jgi:hypothetical protein
MLGKNYNISVGAYRSTQRTTLFFQKTIFLAFPYSLHYWTIIVDISSTDFWQTLLIFHAFNITVVAINKRMIKAQHLQKKLPIDHQPVVVIVSYAPHSQLRTHLKIFF